MNTTLPACLHFVSWLCATVVSVLCYLFHNQQEITVPSQHPTSQAHPFAAPLLWRWSSGHAGVGAALASVGADLPAALPNSHRSTEWLEMEWTLKILTRPMSCPEESCRPPAKAAQVPILPGLRHLRGWGTHCFSGQPVPGSHYPLCENFSA